MVHQIRILPEERNIEVPAGDNLLAALRRAGLITDAPCGGAGKCGKCRVRIDGREALACQETVEADLTVELSEAGHDVVLAEGVALQQSIPGGEGYRLAFDIGTTTVAAYLLDGRTGRELASLSALNPQRVFGADVVSRIRHGIDGELEAMTRGIRDCLDGLIRGLCHRVAIQPGQIRLVSVVGNPAMQQIFLGLDLGNLARIPFGPVLKQGRIVPAAEYLPLLQNAELLVVPDISGFIGADTIACILATRLDERDAMTLLVDIGTNGEMVLGSAHRMVACSAAAGPALEGANIQFGMRAQTGAIDHVWLERGALKCSVIGGGKAAGICGSALVDAVAAALDAGLLNSRGRILTGDQTIALTDGVWLTQEDIRQVQLAKGAIAAGIRLMAAHLGLALEDIEKVYLAGAFGTFMDPERACRIGLLPKELEGKIEAVGNAAGSGAKLLACDAGELAHTQRLAAQVEFMELAAVPGFARCFAENMRF